MLKYLLPASAAAVLLVGCVFAPYRETAYFDLSPEKIEQKRPVAISVSDFKNRSGAGARFQYRMADGQIKTDPDHKWILPPGALIARGLRTAFVPELKKDSFSGRTIQTSEILKIRGELLTFEADLSSSTFRMQARVTVIAGNDASKQIIDFVSSVPLKDKSAGSVVQAVNRACRELAVQINKVR